MSIHDCFKKFFFQVAPVTIHPAFEKGASYFDLKIVHVPLKNYRVDMEEYEKVNELS